MSQHWLKPRWEPYKSIPEIPIGHFLDRNIKALILDVDKTLLDNHEEMPQISVINWINKARKEFDMHILSNNPSKKRISTIAHNLNLPYTYLAAKPRRHSLKKIITSIAINPNKIALIGDRIFTDILVGNRLGVYTVLVTPMGPNGIKIENSKTQSLEKSIAYLLGARN